MLSSKTLLVEKVRWVHQGSRKDDVIYRTSWILQYHYEELCSSLFAFNDFCLCFFSFFFNFCANLLASSYICVCFIFYERIDFLVRLSKKVRNVYALVVLLFKPNLKNIFLERSIRGYSWSLKGRAYHVTIPP